MSRTINKGPSGSGRRAPDSDQASQALIGSDATKPCATAQAHKLEHALAVQSDRAYIGYVLEVDRAVVALDHDGIEIGQCRSRRLAFAAVTESAIGEKPPHVVGG
jgi:hypothetical protein